MVNKSRGGVGSVRSRLALVLVLLLSLQSWTSLPLEQAKVERVDAWQEDPFRDVAVPEPFSHMTLADYGDVAVVINNQSSASRTIGFAFAASRNISPERVFILTNESTPTAETITAEQFDTWFASPILQMISERNLTELNVLVTTKGIPLRVNGGTNARAAFDSELALIGGPYSASIHADWYATSNYGPAAGNEMKAFDRSEQGYYLVTRLTGYDVETALDLLDKTNASLGQHGLTVLDLATNRNGSGYKWWNDLLYTTNTTLNGTLGMPVHFNQNSTFITDMENVSMYASWGSNDGAWNANFLPNVGFDTADAAWSTGARYWDGTAPPLSAGEQWWWTRETAYTRDGDGAMEGRFDGAPCSASDASSTAGLLAEYFDNAGLTYNSSLMPNLTGRSPDVSRGEPNIDWAATSNAWAGLDTRFKDYWSVRHTGILNIPSTDNWTFYLYSDDGTKLWIDGLEVVNNEGVHGMAEVSGIVNLSAGEHTLRTEFYEHGGAAGFHLKWESSSQAKQVIPASAFTRGSSVPVREADLIHHWAFDESSGDVAADSVGSADLSFTGTNGTQWRNCVLGNCAFFDGVDDFAKVDVNDSVGDFTVSLWVQANHSGQPQFSSVIAVNDVAGDDASFQIMTSGATPGQWQVYHNSSYDFGEVDPSIWQHLMVSFTNDTVSQYLDGELVRTTNVSNGSINSIELYKFGVNRAGSTYYTGVIDEVQIWNEALSPEDIIEVNREIVWTCVPFNTTGQTEGFIEQVWDISEGMEGHAWILYGYASSSGNLFGEWWLEVDAYAANGTLLSTNISSSRALGSAWESRTVRFRPHEDATRFVVRQIVELQEGTLNGSVYFDTLNLGAIRPHFSWLDGSIAETAVSTGGRSFTWDTGYGQSLVVDLLEDGVSGVKGYVYEPYLSAISNPDQLLSCYAAGYTLAECYAASNVLLSWMGVVIGDPKMAAYADVLHDVNVSEVIAPETLTMEREGTLEVLLENLAPGVAVGHLEVRDRQNSVVLANVPMSIPGGNDAGSRLIQSVKVMPTRSGYVEFMVRWIPAGGSSPERVLDNNIATLNIQVNQGPSITGSICSTLQAARGGVVTCEVQVADDFGVTSATLSWRINGSANQNWTSVSAGSASQGARWVASITIPPNAPLTFADLSWRIFDAQNISDDLEWPQAFSIIDAPATWVGPHVYGVDISPWLGTDPTPLSVSGWERGVWYPIRACVIDLDHGNGTELPTILVNDVELPEPTYLSASGSQTCYQTRWDTPPAGSALVSVQMTLIADGIEWANRTLIPIDMPPSATLELVGQQHLDGADDRLLIQIIDADDPDIIHGVTTVIEWPGAGTQNLTASTVSAPPNLEQGDALITTTIEGGEWDGLSWQWTRPVLLTPPILSAPVICANGEVIDHLTRGVVGEIWVALLPGRQITSATLRFEDGEQSTSISIQNISEAVPPVSCTPGSGESSRFFLFHTRVVNYEVGPVSLTVLMIDIDGLSGSTLPLTVELRGAAPTLDLSAMPIDMVSGNETTLIVGILDADGNDGTECSILIEDSNRLMLFSEVWYPDAEGVWARVWTPPGLDEANHTLSFVCLDQTGLSAFVSVPLHAREVAPLEAPADNSSKQSEESSISPLLLIPIILIAITALMMMRKEEDEIEDEEELPDASWSKSAGEITDEILFEMAGLEKEWTDEELLAAGWSQEQIDEHRSEQAQTNL
jgi:uncharacterized protein (TIGR03790 family)